MSTQVYLSAADRQLEPFLDACAFERSLVLNVLFQPGVLVPDIFFAISRGIAEHVLSRDRMSLLEACIAAGVVVPAFRGGASSFLEVLKIIRAPEDPTQAIQGVLPSAERVSERLQLAAESGHAFSGVHWPSYDLGERFERILDRYLCPTDPPAMVARPGPDEGAFRRLWQLTTEWRTGCVDEARETTRRIAGAGIRRGELMNAVGRKLGLPAGRRVHDVVELLELASGDRETLNALKCFLRWMTDLYQYNQAISLGVAPTFPVYEPLSGAIATSLLPHPPSPLPRNPVPTIQEPVALPPLRLLLQVSPSELLRIRAEISPSYFAALNSWQRDPTASNEQELRRSVRVYSAELSKLAAKHGDIGEAVAEVIFGPLSPPTRVLLLGLLGSTISVTAAFLPWATAFIALASGGYAVYLWRANKRESILLDVPQMHASDRMHSEVGHPGTKENGGTGS